MKPDRYTPLKIRRSGRRRPVGGFGVTQVVQDSNGRHRSDRGIGPRPRGRKAIRNRIVEPEAVAEIAPRIGCGALPLLIVIQRAQQRKTKPGQKTVAQRRATFVALGQPGYPRITRETSRRGMRPIRPERFQNAWRFDGRLRIRTNFGGTAAHGTDIRHG